MTLDNFLHSNIRETLTGDPYTETEIHGKDGRELTSWQDDDPKYLAQVIDFRTLHDGAIITVTINF